MQRVKTDLKTTSTDDIIDQKYENEMGSPVPYYVLHLSDLNIDPDYVPGASVNCRGFRCCHASNGMVPQSDPNDDKVGEDVAGPFGAKGCDQSLGGAKTLLEKLRVELESEYGRAPHMIVVTGGVVSEQPGQFNT